MVQVRGNSASASPFYWSHLCFSHLFFLSNVCHNWYLFVRKCQNIEYSSFTPLVFAHPFLSCAVLSANYQAVGWCSSIFCFSSILALDRRKTIFSQTGCRFHNKKTWCTIRVSCTTCQCFWRLPVVFTIRVRCNTPPGQQRNIMICGERRLFNESQTIKAKLPSWLFFEPAQVLWG